MKRDNKDWVDVARESLRQGSDEPSAGLWARIEADIPPKRRTHPLRYVASVAAVLLAGLVIGTLIYNEQSTRQTIASKTTPTIKESVVVEPTAESPKIAVLTQKPRKEVATQTVAKEIAPAVDEPATEPVTEPVTEPIRDTPTTKENDTASKRDERVNAHTPSGDINGWPTEFEQPKSTSKLSLGIKAGGTLALSSGAKTNHYTTQTTSLIPDEYGNLKTVEEYDSYTYKHHQPLSFGLSISKGFKYGLSIGTGINYSLLRSKVSMTKGSKELTQSLQFIGIPISMNWAFINKSNFAVYVGIEAEAEKCIKAKFGDQSVSVKPIQWSMHGLVGAQYQLSRSFAIYVEPKISHYFTDTNMKTIRTDRDVHFNMQLGFRITY